MRIPEYIYTVSLFAAVSALLAIAYGWQSTAVSTLLAVCALLLVAIRNEN